MFARDGYDGGRIEQISRAANSYDRMIHYYFGSKEGLFVEVLEEMYRRFNEAEARFEAQLDLEQPVQALEAGTRSRHSSGKNSARPTHKRGGSAS